MSDVQGDFIWSQIYKGALAGGAKERIAKDSAVAGLEDYRKGRFKKGGAGKLINTAISLAVKRSKKA